MDPTLIQEGSYGCAFTPPLKCRKSKQSRSKRQVGKIIRLKNAEVELSIASIVKGIPGWERYFIVQEKDNCTAQNFKNFREAYEEECKTLRRRADKELVQLLSPYGGTTLHSLAITNDFDYLGAFRHMLEGVSKLAKQGICHYDLHEGNILVDHRGTMRLIDFGAAFVGDAVSEETIWRHQYSFSPEYSPQPPELSIQNALNENVPLSFAIHKTFQQKKEFSIASSLLGQRGQEDAMFNFWRSEFSSTSQWPTFFHKYWRTWDSWAVGVIFLKLLRKSFLLSSFTHTVWPKHGFTIRTVLKGLLEVDPRRRLTADTALKMINASA